MAEHFSVTNCYGAYIKNQPYIFPYDTEVVIPDSDYSVNTGWHLIPTQLYRHFFKPKQWYKLQIDYQAFKITGYTVKCFNLVPLMTQINFQQTQLFTSFNSAIYGLAYQDTIGETMYHNWLTQDTDNPDLAQNEGVYRKDSTNTMRYMLPIYHFKVNNVSYHSDWSVSNSSSTGNAVFPQSGKPTGSIWNPFERPNHLMEFRPGKNCITFNWTSTDSQWFNLDRPGSWYPYGCMGPYNGRKRPFTGKLTTECDPDKLTSQYENSTREIHDYTIQNMSDQPLLNQSWYWIEMNRSIMQDPTTDKPDLNWPGTEYETTQNPPDQCFIKMLPLFDENDNLIPITAYLSIQVTLHMQVKARESAYFAPTWGPFNGNSLYSMTPKHRQFTKSYVRYRTKGARQSWQNWLKHKEGSNNQWKQAHAREDPYNYTGDDCVLEKNPSDSTGLNGTRALTNNPDTIDGEPKFQNIQITVPNDQRMTSPMRIFQK
ncbi:capsid protein [Grus japonensis parvovirus 3]|uniref:Capsid protein n=1 Tax=Grus japonensis parvovirus 3 TaxID=3071218 RepID=A0A2K9YN87_9VIRU|nr:capsid protein [Parvoviridae sp.]AUW34320.1 capsid protein [Grus japonensis parvovirus 3]